MISFKPNFVAPAKFGKLTPRIRQSTPINVTPASSQMSAPMLEGGQNAQSIISTHLANCAYSLNHRLFLPTYFRQIQVSGQQLLPREGAVIFAPTHRSRWDAMLVPYAVGPHVTGRYPHYMVTIDEMQGVQGWFIRRMGGFPVNTRSPGVSSLRHGIELLHQRQSLVIFPEGGNLLENRRMGVNHLHPGLARIALKASLTQPDCAVQIVPMAINYQYELGRVDRRAVDIRIGAPLSVRDYLSGGNKHSAQLITHELQSVMSDLSGCKMAAIA